jgi:hypothetical protein
MMTTLYTSNTHLYLLHSPTPQEFFGHLGVLMKDVDNIEDCGAEPRGNWVVLTSVLDRSNRLKFAAVKRSSLDAFARLKLLYKIGVMIQCSPTPEPF